MLIITSVTSYPEVQRLGWEFLGDSLWILLTTTHIKGNLGRLCPAWAWCRLMEDYLQDMIMGVIMDKICWNTRGFWQALKSILYLSLWETVWDNIERMVLDGYIFWSESREKKFKGKKEWIQFQQIVELFHLLGREWGQAMKQIKYSISVRFSTTERKETSKA